MGWSWYRCFLLFISLFLFKVVNQRSLLEVCFGKLSWRTAVFGFGKKLGANHGKRICIFGRKKQLSKAKILEMARIFVGAKGWISICKSISNPVNQPWYSRFDLYRDVFPSRSRNTQKICQKKGFWLPALRVSGPRHPQNPSLWDQHVEVCQP